MNRTWLNTRVQARVMQTLKASLGFVSRYWNRHARTLCECGAAHLKRGALGINNALVSSSCISSDRLPKAAPRGR